MPKRKFAILRVAKLKTLNNIRGASAHNRREIDTPNADSKIENHYWGSSDPARAAQDLWSALNIRPRSNAVMGNEYVLTASPEFWKGKTREYIGQWTKDALRFVKDKHGKGLLQASLHLDESSPHLQVIITPVYRKPDGTWGLSAKHFFDNPQGRKVPESQKRLSILQTEFAKHMQDCGHDLERGIKGSRAKHKLLRTYYSELEQTIDRAREETSLALEEAEEFTEEHDKPGLFNIKKLFQRSKQIIQRLAEKLKRLEEANAALKKQFDDKVRRLNDQVSILLRDRRLLNELYEKTRLKKRESAHSLLISLANTHQEQLAQKSEQSHEPQPVPKQEPGIASREF